MARHRRIGGAAKEGLILIGICGTVFVIGMGVMHYDSIRTILMEKPHLIDPANTSSIADRYDNRAQLTTAPVSAYDPIAAKRDTIHDVSDFLMESAEHVKTTPDADIEDYVRRQRPHIDLPLNTLPPETRVYIDSIDVSAPILNLINPPEEKLLAADFGEELKEGVVHYPGTAPIGGSGATLIFGHSSISPWETGHKYGDVFAKLSYLTNGQRITVFDNGIAHTYKVTGQKVVWPKEVPNVFDENNTDETNKLLLMACYPTFTDLQRIVIIAEPIDETDTDSDTTHA